jgi:hypothetical protein
MTNSVYTFPVYITGASGSITIQTTQTLPALGWLNISNPTDASINVCDYNGTIEAEILPYCDKSIQLSAGMAQQIMLTWTNPNIDNTTTQLAIVYLTDDSYGWATCYAPSAAIRNGSLNMTVTNTATITGTVVVNNTVPVTGTVAISNTVGVTGSISVNNTVPVTGTVNIGNSSIAVTNSGAGSLNVAGTVNIGNTPAVTINGTPVVAIAAGQNINISGTPTVNATISGTPTVNIGASNTVEVINTSGGALTVGGTVNIGNSPAVTISGTPTVAIAAAQTISISNTPSVIISGTPTVAIAANQSVNVGNVISATISSGTVTANISNASLNAQVINEQLNVNGSTVMQYSQAINVPANSYFYLGLGVASAVLPLALYDRVTVYVESPNGSLGHLGFAVQQLREDINNKVWYNSSGFGSMVPDPGCSSDDSTRYMWYTPVEITPARPFSLPLIAGLNTIAINETFTVVVVARYATSRIDNLSSNPAQQQPAQGSYDTPLYINQNTSASAWTTLIAAAGNYIKQIRLSVSNYGTLSVPSFLLCNSLGNSIANILYAGGALPAGASVQIDISIPNGIYCNGLQLYDSAAYGFLTIQGMVVQSSATPASRVATIV